MRAFLDAVADTLPAHPRRRRTPPGAPFAAREPQRLPRRPRLGRRGRRRHGRGGAGLAAPRPVRLRALRHADLADGRSDSARTPADAACRRAPSCRCTASPTRPSSPTPPALWAGDGATRRSGRAPGSTRCSPLRRAARVWPPLDRLLEQAVPDVLALSDDELYELLGVAGDPARPRPGSHVHWPRELARTLTAARRRAARARARPPTAPRFFDSRANCFAFDWQLALGGDPLTEAEMDTLAEAHRPVVRLRDQWVRRRPGPRPQGAQAGAGPARPGRRAGRRPHRQRRGRRRDGRGGARSGALRRAPRDRLDGGRRPGRSRRPASTPPCATTSCAAWPGWTG